MRLILTALTSLILAACAALPGASGSRSSAPRTEVLIDNLKIPMSLAFAPDGCLFFNEVSEGRVRVFQNGTLQDAPWATFEVARGPETGLLGLTLNRTSRRIIMSTCIIRSWTQIDATMYPSVTVSSA